MNAESFHARATALKKKGPMALFSGGEIKKLMAEGQAAGKAAGARYDADKQRWRELRAIADAKEGRESGGTTPVRGPVTPTVSSGGSAAASTPR